MSGKLLERKGVGDSGPAGEDGGVAQQVEPSEAGGQGQHGQEPGKHRAPKRRRRDGAATGRRALACLAWLGAGLSGVFAYGHDYWVYRGFAPPRDPPGVKRGSLLLEHFHSQAMHAERSYLIYLPPGYAAAAARGQRFPVLYLLHGSPGDGNLFFNAAGVGVDLDELIAQKRVRPFMIVAPAGWRRHVHARHRVGRHAAWPYETLALEAVHAVDSRWATLADRGAPGDRRQLGGRLRGGQRRPAPPAPVLSRRGLVGLLHAGWLQRPVRRAPRGRLWTRTAPAIYVPSMAPALHRLPFHAYIYSGRHELPAKGNAVFARELAGAGAGVDFATLPGGHTWELWRAQAPRMLLFAANWFASAGG